MRCASCRNIPRREACSMSLASLNARLHRRARHPEVLRTILFALQDRPDSSEYLRMTVSRMTLTLLATLLILGTWKGAALADTPTTQPATPLVLHIAADPNNLPF